MLLRFFKGLTLAILVLFAVKPLSAQTANRSFLSEYVQTLYGEESVIPVIAVKAVIQTSDGYLWFGGYQGLMRYDGIAVKRFLPEDGFSSFAINLFYEDGRNRLWIGTNDAGIFLYENNSFTAYSIKDGLPSASIRGICEDEDGNIYVSTAGGIAVISGDDKVEGKVAPHPVLLNMYTSHIRSAGKGNLLCLLNDGSIILFDKEKVIQTFTAGNLGISQPKTIFLSGDGSLYIGTVDNKVYITDLEMLQQTPISHKMISTSPLQSHINFFEDSEGRVWVCADNGIGYLSKDGGNFKYTHVDGLVISTQIECIYEDHEGNYWIGSSRAGFVQLTRSKFTNISFLAQMPNYIVNSTALFKNNEATDLYIGTDRGLVILRNNIPIRNELSKMLEGIRIRNLFIDSKKNLWIGAFERFGVLLVKQDGSVISINSDKGLASNRVRVIMEASNGDIYVGMTGGISVIRNEKVIKNYTEENGLTNEIILSLCEGKNGVIYAGSDGGGIYAIDGDKITNYSEKDGLAAGVVMRLTFVGEGIWISTGSALCYMEESPSGARISVIEKIELYDDTLFDIKGIGDEIWFLQTKSISICNVDNLLSDDELTRRQLQRHDGLSSPITANSWSGLTDNGVLYICTSTGVFSIDTRSPQQKATAPYTRVSEIFADGKLVLADNKLVLEKDGVFNLGKDVHRVDIHFSLLSFVSKGGTISYMLEGFDNEFTTANRSDVQWVSYTNLGGGSYAFHLYGTNADGLQSDTVILTINKEHAFFERLVVRIMLIVIGISIIAFFTWYVVSKRAKEKTKRLEESNIILEATVKERTRELEEQTEIAVRANKAKSEFLAIMSHELRTPLNAVIGFSEIELRKKHEESSRDNISKIHQSGSYLLGIFNDILDIQKIETGKFEIIAEEYETPALVSAAVNLNRVRIGNKPVQFILEIDGGFPAKLTGDELRIRQILSNLLSNAIKYTEEGTVTLSVSHEQSEGKNVIVRFSVKDTGIGVRPDDIDKLFSDYTQVDTRANRKVEGTGLGLSIVKRLTLMMGGDISVESEYGSGSCFTAWIIQEINETSVIGEETANALRNFKWSTTGQNAVSNRQTRSANRSILIVDDLPTNLLILRGLLEPYGLEIDTAASGQEAISKVKEKKYDLVFMDHMMPDMDGLEALRGIRENSLYAGVPVIAVTANAMSGMEEFYSEQGFQGFISKPILPQALNEIITGYFK